MSKRKKKILAYIGLGFMAICSVALIMYMFNPNLWNGGIAFIALFTGVGGIACLFTIKQFSKKDEPYLPEQPDTDKGGDDIESGIAEFETSQQGNEMSETAKSVSINETVNADIDDVSDDAKNEK